MASGPVFDHFVTAGTAIGAGPIFGHNAEVVSNKSSGPVFDHDTAGLRTGGGPPFGAALAFTLPLAEDLLSRLIGRGHPETEVSYARIASVEGVDLTETPASTPLYKTPTGKTAIIHMVVLRCTQADVVTGVPLAGIGVSGTDVYQDQQILGLNAEGKRFIFPGGPGSRAILAADDTLNLVVSQAAAASVLTVTVDVFGDEF